MSWSVFFIKRSWKIRKTKVESHQYEYISCVTYEHEYIQYECIYKLEIKDKKLANTLRRIAQDPDNFYNGELAEDIAADLAQVGSWINITDLNIYDVNITEPLKSDFDGKEFYFPKAQASGPILQLMLNILDGYELNKENHLTEVRLMDNQFCRWHHTKHIVNSV